MKHDVHPETAGPGQPLGEFVGLAFQPRLRSRAKAERAQAVRLKSATTFAPADLFGCANQRTSE